LSDSNGLALSGLEQEALNQSAEWLNKLAKLCHKANLKWWYNPKTRVILNRNRGEMLMLMVSELAEAMEGERKDLMDTHLPHRKMAEVELADAIIRILDYAAGLGYDIGGAFFEKTLYNAKRADHTDAARLAPGGKKF
jgi:NTP pyrophosphatase (non-canonical NTP hydrolase)